MTQFDSKAVSKVANVRPEVDESTPQYEGAEIKKLGSRVTSRQATIINEVLTTAQKKLLTGTSEKLGNMQRYADTGDRSALNGEQSAELGKIVEQAKAKALEASDVKGESQARRIWPRKVAAIVVTIVSE